MYTEVLKLNHIDYKIVPVEARCNLLPELHHLTLLSDLPAGCSSFPLISADSLQIVIRISWSSAEAFQSSKSFVFQLATQSRNSIKERMILKMRAI